MPQQLALPFSFNPTLGFAQFHSGSNAEAVEHLRRAAEGRGELLIFLWGGAGSGKTHLLNACCQAAADAGRSVSYLPLALFRPYGPDSLEGLEDQDLVCLDDVDAVAGDPVWEAGLFTLFNRLRESARELVLTAAVPPSALPIRLPDLSTRLGWGLTLHLHPLEDPDKLKALEHYAESLGMHLPPQVGQFLLARYRRDLPALRELLDQLDRASLAAQRRLSIPFVKGILGEHP
jgi:DnaA family protein